VFLLLLDGMLLHHRALPRIKLVGAYVYTWAERGAVRVKVPIQVLNAEIPTKVYIWGPFLESPVFFSGSKNHS